ncbi:MAG TPA: MaoC family dehydratase N-terminal domain-containing protein [Rhizomicrobium sp.]|nr:MaoC family dehydratase N-terminal domain-containing protein [Rhizomicrobium sp.]
MPNLQSWIGRTETTEDIASPVPLAGLAALLDHETPPWPEGEVPPLGHWLYFLNRARQSEIDSDGHPKRGGFLPPIALPRRMWAGGRIAFVAPIQVGAAITRRSTIAGIEAKTGASGEMIFLTVHHEVASGGRIAIREEQDVVFRGAPSGEAAKPVAEKPMPTPEHNRMLVPDITQLFRFSALTFNAHRIHYDRDYARDVEGYPGLVVQGPYTAMLLMDLALRHGARPARFSFRARKPHFEGRPLTLCASANALWSVDETGATGMSATILPSP